MDQDLIAAAGDLLDRCREAGLKLATAESCTGGLIAATLTEIPGSSDVLDRGFITYSNAAKIVMLGVPEETLSRHGAVSEQVAQAMAAGALACSDAHVAVAVTGIAGPGGGTPEKPVGLVHLVVASKQGKQAHKRLELGDPGRAEIRRRSVLEAIRLAVSLL